MTTLKRISGHGAVHTQFASGAQRMPNGQIANYVYDPSTGASHLVVGQQNGQTLYRDSVTGEQKIAPAGFQQIGATPMGNPNKNIGAIPESRNFIPPRGLAQGAPAKGPTQTGATVDTAAKPPVGTNMQPPSAPTRNLIQPHGVEAMQTFNNRDRRQERGDVGIAGGSGAGQQTVVSSGDTGVVTAVDKAPAPSPTETRINSFMPAVAGADGTKSIASRYGSGSVRTMPASTPSYVGSEPPPPLTPTGLTPAKDVAENNSFMPTPVSLQTQAPKAGVESIPKDGSTPNAFASLPLNTGTAQPDNPLDITGDVAGARAARNAVGLAGAGYSAKPSGPPPLPMTTDKDSGMAVTKPGFMLQSGTQPDAVTSCGSGLPPSSFMKKPEDEEDLAGKAPVGRTAGNFAGFP